MFSLEKYLLPPSPERLDLLKVILVITLLVHLPYLSLVIGTAILSLVFNILYRIRKGIYDLRFARDVLQSFLNSKTICLALGLFPVVTLAVTYSQISFTSNIITNHVWLAIILLELAGFLALHKYIGGLVANRKKNLPWRIATGALAVLLLVGAYFNIMLCSSLLVDVEKLGLLNNPIQILYSWNITSRFLQFFTFSLALTGGGIIFLFFGIKSRKETLEPNYLDFVRKIGIGMGLIFSIAQPALALWNVLTLPDISITNTIFDSYLVILVLLVALCHILYNAIYGKTGVKQGIHIFSLFVIIFSFIIVNDYISANASLRDHTNYLSNKYEEARKAIALTSGTREVSDKLGEMIFRQRCSLCHDFTKRLVGPPFDKTIPQYKDKMDDLKNFIRNPVKINADYPSMPKLGLAENEIESVASYLLKEAEKMEQK